MFADDEEQFEEEVLLLAALLEEDNSNKNAKKEKNIWIHDINLKRKEEGEFHTLYAQLRMNEDRFFIYFIMNIECFDEILNFIKDDITKNHTHYREPIGAEERLVVTLRFLVTGDSYKTIGHSFRMGFSTVSIIVEEVCTDLWDKLKPIYMPEPTKELWEKSMSGFKDLWQFPNCLGSIDGKHVTIKCPQKSGSNYFCYLKKFSIVLMAIVDPNYKFICIDVGAYGKNSDGGIFEASNMGQRFATGSLSVPPDRPLPGGNENVPCVLVGDEAFALSPYLMRPFPYRQSRYDNTKEKFNYHLCVSRRVVENAFGHLAHKFRVLFRPLEVKVPTTISIVKATCILHNMIRTKKIDLTFVHIQEPNISVQALNNMPVDPRRAPNYAFNVKEKFVHYFSTLNTM